MSNTDIAVLPGTVFSITIFDQPVGVLLISF